MQRDGRLVGFGGGEGQAGPSIGVGCVNLGRFVEGGKGLGETELAGQVLSVRNQQVRIFGVGGKQGAPIADAPENSGSKDPETK